MNDEFPVEGILCIQTAIKEQSILIAKSIPEFQFDEETMNQVAPDEFRVIGAMIAKPTIRPLAVRQFRHQCRNLACLSLHY